MAADNSAGTGRAPSAPKQARNFVFTLHASDDADSWTAELAHLEHLSGHIDDAGIKFFGGQLELAPTTNKEHFQGYIGFKSVKTFAQVKRILGADRYAELDNIHANASSDWWLFMLRCIVSLPTNNDILRYFTPAPLFSGSTWRS